MNIPTEYIAVFITIVVTSLINYGVNYYRSHKGNRVLLSFGWSSSLIAISEKYARDFSITYKNQPIEKLMLYEFSLYNDGDIDIDDLSELTVDFYPENSQKFFMDFQAQDTAQMIEIHPFEVYQGGDISYYSVRISRPYLNSKKKLKEENITLYVFSNTPIEKIDVRGGGKSWRASYKDSTPRANMLALVKVIPYIYIFVILSIVAYILLSIELGVFSYFQEGFSYRALLGAIVFFSYPLFAFVTIDRFGDFRKQFKKYLTRTAPINYKKN